MGEHFVQLKLPRTRVGYAISANSVKKQGWTKGQICLCGPIFVTRFSKERGLTRTQLWCCRRTDC